MSRKNHITLYVYELFKKHDEELQTELNKIYKQQEALTGTPNFFYKGNVFNIDKQSIKPIHKSLKKDIENYMNMYNQGINQEITLTHYLTNQKRPLHQIIPEYAQHIMGLNGKCIIDLPKEIHDILKEQLLNAIL